ncbi:uncharacterized protein [Anoplolepis gracilipes]|uniref:uncharacterized protein n=1 Tax=Anoplolepis gracilipes TaxID=354296 RepID=UPI003BA3DAE1
MAGHNYVRYSITPHRTSFSGDAVNSAKRWCLRKWNKDLFAESLQYSMWQSQPHTQNDTYDFDTACSEVKRIVNKVTEACDASMPRLSTKRYSSAYWWNDEISTLCKASIKARRKMTRLKRTANNAELREQYVVEYRDARKLLCNAIRKSQRTAWQELLDGIDSDPWGRPYKLVMKKIGGPMSQSPLQLLPEDQLVRIILTLFPAGDRENQEDLPVIRDVIEGYTAIQMNELNHAVKRMLRKSAAPRPGMEY